MNLQNVRFVILILTEQPISLIVYAKISSLTTVKAVHLVIEFVELVKITPQTVLHVLESIDQIIYQFVFVYRNSMILELVTIVLVNFT